MDGIKEIQSDQSNVRLFCVQSKPVECGHREGCDIQLISGHEDFLHYMVRFNHTEILFFDDYHVMYARCLEERIKDNPFDVVAAVTKPDDSEYSYELH